MSSTPAQVPTFGFRTNCLIPWFPTKRTAWVWDWLLFARPWNDMAERFNGIAATTGPVSRWSFRPSERRFAMPTLLVVDDEPSICWGLTRLGEEMGHEVLTA